jgi:hypothetical protein
MEKAPLPDGVAGCVPDGFCREFEITFLAGRGESRDFRFLFGGREGSDETRPRGLDVFARLFSAFLREGSEIQDAGFSSTE